MRNYDFTPLYRSTIGFDHLASLMDRAMSVDVNTNGYPPYNIERMGEDQYRISVAVAGFSDDELSIEMRDHQLSISARKAEAEKEQEVTYLHRGIAARSFEKKFQLADHVRASSAETRDGILHVDLIREVPEALKPRKIAISSANKTIEAKPKGKKIEKV